MPETQALKFEHKLSSEEDKEKVSLAEYFIPYSADVLLENEFISEELYDLLSVATIGSLSEIFENKDVSFNFRGGDWINADGSYEDTSLFDYIADFKGVMGLVDENLSDDKIINLGLLTECAKIIFWLFKIDISILRLLYFSDIFDENGKLRGNIDLDVINSGIRNIASHYDSATFQCLQKDGINSEADKSAVKSDARQIYTVVQKMLEDINKGVYIDVDTSFSKTVNEADSVLLDKYFQNEGRGCYCIVQYAKKCYFSYSGFDDYTERKEKLFIETKKALEALNEEKYKAVVPCRFALRKTKSYGLKSELGFIHFPRPLKLIDMGIYPIFFCEDENDTFESELRQPCTYDFCKHVFPKTNLSVLYMCCERKVFPNLGKESIVIVRSRWAPCERCELAVFEEIKRHINFEYIAFALDGREFRRMLKDKNKRQLWKLSVVREKSTAAKQSSSEQKGK